MPDYPIPTLYLRVYEAGLVDHNKQNCLALSDTEWLPPEEITEYEPPEFLVPGLIPFAMNGRGDHWCWFTEWVVDGEPAVVFSPHDVNLATGYAPNFTGCLYRLLLEEMSSSWLVGVHGHTEEEVSASFRRYAEDLAPFLPAPWGDTLRELSQRALQATDDGCHAVLTCEEADDIIRRDLAFDGLNVEFKQHQ